MNLKAYLESRRDIPFEWGVNDCAKFCAGWVGIDLPWADEESAQAYIAKFGSIEGAVDAHLERIPVNQALKGDIMQGKEGSLGICVGPKVATPTDSGLRFVRRDHYVRAWKCRR